MRVRSRLFVALLVSLATKSMGGQLMKRSSHGSGKHRRLFRRRVSRRRLPILFLASLVTACASSGAGVSGPGRTTVSVIAPSGATRSIEISPTTFVNESILAATPTQVWTVLPAVFDQLQVEVTTVDSRSRVMGNAGYLARRVEGKRLSIYLECGSDFTGPYANQHDVTLSLMVQLTNAPENETVVTTVVNASAKPRAVSGTRLQCTSKRSLERRVVELIAEKLAGGSVEANLWSR